MLHTDEKHTNQTKIAIAGTGYADLSIGIFLAQNNEVVAKYIISPRVLYGANI